MSRFDRALTEEFDEVRVLSQAGSKPEYTRYAQKPDGSHEIVMSIRVPDHKNFPNIDGKKAKHRPEGTGNSDKPFHDDMLVRKCAMVVNECNRRNPEDRTVGIYIKDPDLRIMSVYGQLDSTVDAARSIRRIFSAYSNNELARINPLQTIQDSNEDSNVVPLHEEKHLYVHFDEGYDVKRLSGTMKTSFDRLKNFIEKHFDTVSVTPNSLYEHGVVLNGMNRFNVDAAANMAGRGIRRIQSGQLISEKWLLNTLPEVIEVTESRPEKPNYHGIVTDEPRAAEIVPNQTVKIFAPSQG